VHLAGETVAGRWTESKKRRIRDSRVLGTRLLADTAAAHDPRPRTFVSASAIGYYGDRGEQILDEESPPGENGFVTEVPIDWEAAEREAEGIVPRVVIFRTGLVLTKHGGLLRQLLLPFRLGVGGPIAGGEQFMSWIHIEDEIGLFLWALDDDRVSGTINATAPNPVTNREFSKALGRALHRPAVFPVPKLAVSAMRGAELADAVAGGARVLPRRALDLGYDFRYPDLDEALATALR
jgi:uncharacterized protein (TIGR01777 family)